MQLKITPATKLAVYRYMAQQKVVSKAQLQAHFAFHSSSLTRLLDDFIAEGLIVESGYGQSTGGRKPILYQIKATASYMLGLDISRSSSTLGLFDMTLTPLAFVSWTMDQSMTPKQLVSHVVSAVQALLTEHAITAEQLIGLGVGAVGPLDRSSGTIINPSYFPAMGWNNVPLKAWLEEALQLPVQIEAGANTALLAEHWCMEHENAHHLLYVHAGVSLRSAMMSSGSLIHGAVENEDAISQMIVQADGIRLHEHSNYGALEAYCSIQAIERQVLSQLKLGRQPLSNAVTPEQLNLQLLLDELQHNNSYVVQLFEQAATYLGIGLANLINVFHPEIIILGGPLHHKSDLFFKTAIAAAKSRIMKTPLYEPTFSRGKLQERAVTTGAAILVYAMMRM
ncbi:ROK family protein [Paenibacillus yanchengensis]|uniref:ROK family protein n=1 Tax=Paenibacillus yanchengensis TaxID=2035833 RepID=A0ABW4YIE9_9BACL